MHNVVLRNTEEESEKQNNHPKGLWSPYPLSCAIVARTPPPGPLLSLCILPGCWYRPLAVTSLHWETSKTFEAGYLQLQLDMPPLALPPSSIRVFHPFI